MVYLYHVPDATPSQGMTTTNMQLVTLDVPLADKLETPDQKLEEGESIVKRVVALSGLYQELKGGCFLQSNPCNDFKCFQLQNMRRR